MLSVPSGVDPGGHGHVYQVSSQCYGSSRPLFGQIYIRHGGMGEHTQTNGLRLEKMGLRTYANSKGPGKPWNVVTSSSFAYFRGLTQDGKLSLPFFAYFRGLTQDGKLSLPFFLPISMVWLKMESCHFLFFCLFLGSDSKGKVVTSFFCLFKGSDSRWKVVTCFFAYFWV